MLQEVLFAYRTSQHSSTKFSPFFYTIPKGSSSTIDIKYCSHNEINVEECDFRMDFDERKFKKTLENMVLIRGISNFKLFIAIKFNNIYTI